MVQTALDEGIDLVIAGAGFSRDVFTWCREAGTPMVPIVGSARVAKLSEKFGAVRSGGRGIRGRRASGHGPDDARPAAGDRLGSEHPGDRRRRSDHGARHPRGSQARRRGRADGFAIRRHGRVLGAAGLQADVRGRDTRRGRAHQEPRRAAWPRTEEPVLGADPGGGLSGHQAVHLLPEAVSQGVLHHQRARDGRKAGTWNRVSCSPVRQRPMFTTSRPSRSS